MIAARARESKRAYAKRNPDTNRLRAHRKRARKAGLDDTITLAEWKETLAAYNGRCAYCGGQYDEIDHCIPISKGGGSVKGNMVPACFHCSRTKGAQTWTPRTLRQPSSGTLLVTA